MQDSPHICCYVTRNRSITSWGRLHYKHMDTSPHDEPEESSKGQPTDQIVPVHQPLANPAVPSAIMQVLHSFQPFLPCITAITQQQAILTVTSATHLTEGWIILSIITLSFRVLNRNLNKRGFHILCRMWHFLKSIITLTVPAAKSKSE